MQGRDGIAQALALSERYDHAWDEHLGPVLDEAIRAVDCAWAILAVDIQRFGYDAERPVPDNATKHSHFDAIKWDALEMSDSIYSSLSSEEREKDDRDLEEFEATYLLREDYSQRIKALAFLIVAKELVNDT